MSAEQIVSLLSGGTTALGFAVIWLTLLISGKQPTSAQLREVKEQLKLEQTRNEVKDKIIEEQQRTIKAANERADQLSKSSEIMAEAFLAAGQRRSSRVQKAP